MSNERIWEETHAILDSMDIPHGMSGFENIVDTIMLYCISPEARKKPFAFAIRYFSGEENYDSECYVRSSCTSVIRRARSKTSEKNWQRMFGDKKVFPKDFCIYCADKVLEKIK